jgi:uncharacterized damage-inducible protein DinB
MLDALRDLYAHQAWADAQHWAALSAAAGALRSEELKDRLVHLHGAQRIWLGRWKGASVPFPTPGQFTVLEEIRTFAQATHRDLATFLSGLDEHALAATIRYTDLKGSAHAQPLGGLMLHLALHSQYHRGQNASLLKRLGHPAPATDFVQWLRAGKPAAYWP